ncbi:hypothetical protein NXC12_PD00167 (plasmid) [Rhizobium etli]|uniref:Uncharacterized protein n=1 Tax=Rhizobium etli TaxID=29449 RepID=A0AAN1BLA4_RHIET|nr:hypothetical protein NXC12_PD00167 [Rhizobium etli]
MVWLAVANIVARFRESLASCVPSRAGQTASALLCLEDRDHPNQNDDVLGELEHETLSPVGDAYQRMSMHVPRQRQLWL